MAFLMGIDGGGTGCRARILGTDIDVSGIGTAGPANIMTNFDGAHANIVRAAENACIDAGLPETAIREASAYLGLAGANIGDYAQRIAARLPFARSHVETDAAISLQGAIGDNDGVVAIIGTGSVFVSRSGRDIRVAGGWGFMIGDLGSGSRLGRSLLQETLLAFDGIRDSSSLTSAVLDKFRHDPRTIVEFAHTAQPYEFGSFAPMVFEFAGKRDPAAEEIVANAVADIEETLSALLFNKQNQRLCMLGGLGRVYKDLLSKRYRNLISEPLGDALSGAVALAEKTFAPTNGNDHADAH